VTSRAHHLCARSNRSEWRRVELQGGCVGTVIAIVIVMLDSAAFEGEREEVMISTMSWPEAFVLAVLIVTWGYVLSKWFS